MVQRAQVEPVHPAVQRSQVAPVRPVVQGAQVELVHPVVQSTRTRFVNPKAKDYTVPVPPVCSRDLLGLRAEVEEFKAERRRKRAERCSEKPQEIIDLTKGKDSPVQELLNHPPLLEKNSEGKVCILFLQALKEKYNPNAGLVRLQDLTEIVKEDKMLSDATIMMALDAIVAKAQGRGRKIKAVDTYFFPALKDFGYDKVRHLFLHEDLFELELFLVPIHHPRMLHWSLLAIKPKENKIIVYDSIRRSVHPQVAHVQSFMENHFGDLHGVPNSFKGEDLEKTIAFAGLQEPGSVDCGLFVNMPAWSAPTPPSRRSTERRWPYTESQFSASCLPSSRRWRRSKYKRALVGVTIQHHVCVLSIIGNNINEIKCERPSRIRVLSVDE